MTPSQSGTIHGDSLNANPQAPAQIPVLGLRYGYPKLLHSVPFDHDGIMRSNKDFIRATNKHLRNRQPRMAALKQEQDHRSQEEQERERFFTAYYENAGIRFSNVGGMHLSQRTTSRGKFVS